MAEHLFNKKHEYSERVQRNLILLNPLRVLAFFFYVGGFPIKFKTEIKYTVHNKSFAGY